jgi:hypothetical protein
MVKRIFLLFSIAVYVFLSYLFYWTINYINNARFIRLSNLDGQIPVLQYYSSIVLTAYAILLFTALSLRLRRRIPFDSVLASALLFLPNSLAGNISGTLLLLFGLVLGYRFLIHDSND